MLGNRVKPVSKSYLGVPGIIPGIDDEAAPDVSAPERMITLFPTAKSFAAFVWQKKPNKCEPKTKIFQTETETSTTAVFSRVGGFSFHIPLFLNL